MPSVQPCKDRTSCPGVLGTGTERGLAPQGPCAARRCWAGRQPAGEAGAGPRGPDVTVLSPGNAVTMPRGSRRGAASRAHCQSTELPAAKGSRQALGRLSLGTNAPLRGQLSMAAEWGFIAGHAGAPVPAPQATERWKHSAAAPPFGTETSSWPSSDLTSSPCFAPYLPGFGAETTHCSASRARRVPVSAAPLPHTA